MEVENVLLSHSCGYKEMRERAHPPNAKKPFDHSNGFFVDKTSVIRYNGTKTNRRQSISSGVLYEKFFRNAPLYVCKIE